MICYLFSEPSYFVFSPDVPALLYYAQIPATVIALIFSFYVFWNGREFLLNRLLFAIAIFFSLWTTTTLIAWTNISGDFIAFIWSFFGLILGLISIFCVYFIYVFLEKKDISIKLKFGLLSLLAPVLILASTNFNISGFNITNCDAFDFEWLPFKVYGTALGVLAMIWILVLLVRKYRVSASDFRKQIVLMGIGIELFLFSFFGMEFLATYLTKIGILPDSQLELYGLFGMVIFMIYISILTVRFKTFNVKLIATQALVWGLMFLVGSQFFFIKETTNFILTGITFVGVIIFGQLLIKSVKIEIKQKERLEILLKQRESLTHLVTHKVKGSFTRSKYIFAEMVEGTFGKLSKELQEMAEKGLNSDNEGIATVDLVLNAANLQTGTVKYEMKPVDFKEIVSHFVDELKDRALSKGLKFETDIKDGDYNISGDSFWLKEVVHNLIDNSIRYTKEGSVKVGLEKKITSTQGERNKILFYVKDTGVGINDEDKKNLFTEGGRGKNSVSVNVDSTGYGLFTVKLIVDAHKGRIWAESEGDNKGTTFFVELNA
ncbi:MAG: ATP-binding protein [Minisyncoccia bacterium]